MADHYTELRKEEQKNLKELERYFTDKLNKHQHELNYAKEELKDIERKSNKIKKEIEAHNR